eukprot:TRINITY_DN109407_c0_g1_i1.p1 TRINITY_DN109407_c0_g1~~TRINITY_DN109407_c0_g1_i1.p1  ORF type:complete len:123 (+),score=10.08 TRINITY_DN109407_c0_g1_i1:116-484(+)
MAGPHLSKARWVNRGRPLKDRTRHSTSPVGPNINFTEAAPAPTSSFRRMQYASTTNHHALGQITIIPLSQINPTMSENIHDVCGPQSNGAEVISSNHHCILLYKTPNIPSLPNFQEMIFKAG